MMDRLTDAIKHLLIINILLFVAPKLLDFDLQGFFALHFPESPDFGFWQYITYMFMHSQQGIFHILFNMYALWAFGSPLEQMWGSKKFLFYYLSAGVGAALIYTGVNYLSFNAIYGDLINIGITKSEISELLKIRVNVYDSYFFQRCEQILTGNPSLVPGAINPKLLVDINQLYHAPAVGASGAVYGILVAFGMSFPNAKLGLIFIPVPIAAKYFIPGIILVDLLSGVTGVSIFGSNIAHFAHVGGALVGFLIFKYWKKNQFKRWD